MGTHIDDDGKHRHDGGTTEGGRWASMRLPEPQSLTSKPPASKREQTLEELLDAVDACGERMVQIIGRISVLTADEATHSTPEGTKELAELELERAQVNFDAHKATHTAGAALYAEIGKEGAEDILMSIEFNLPADSTSASVVAHAAMDDEEFALEVFKRAGSRFVGNLDDQSLAMILGHESEEVRVAAVLAGATLRRGDFTTNYIGKYPQQAIVDAANQLHEMTGKADRFALNGELLISASDKLGIAEDRLSTLAESYDWKLKEPKLRAA